MKQRSGSSGPLAFIKHSPPLNDGGTESWTLESLHDLQCCLLFPVFKTTHGSVDVDSCYQISLARLASLWQICQEVPLSLSDQWQLSTSGSLYHSNDLKISNSFRVPNCGPLTSNCIYER